MVYEEMGNKSLWRIDLDVLGFLRTHEDEIIMKFYHIQDYGAHVDSVFYTLYDFRLDVPLNTPLRPIAYNLTAYPNPFNSSITISLNAHIPKPCTVIISDILGRTIWKSVTINSTLVWRGVSSLGVPVSSGKYWIRIMNNSGDNQFSTYPIILLR